MYRIGIDVGGTFTDVVAIDQTGQVTLAKAPSTPQDQSIGVIDGLTRLAERLSLSLSDLLRQAERIVHGTTVVTNAIIEQKGAKTALITTAGFRDVLELRRVRIPELYNFLYFLFSLFYARNIIECYLSFEFIHHLSFRSSKTHCSTFASLHLSHKKDPNSN